MINWFLAALFSYAIGKGFIGLILGLIGIIVYRWHCRDGVFDPPNAAKQKISYHKSNLTLLTLFVISLVFLPMEPLDENFSLAISKGNSMTHAACSRSKYEYEICDSNVGEDKSLDFDGYWEFCGQWYEEHNISKEQFSQFPFSEGFNGWGLSIDDLRTSQMDVEIGDVVVFKGLSSPRTRHRIVDIDDKHGLLTAKGDANNYSDWEIFEKDIIRKVIFNIPLDRKKCID